MGNSLLPMTQAKDFDSLHISNLFHVQTLSAETVYILNTTRSQCFSPLPLLLSVHQAIVISCQDYHTHLLTSLSSPAPTSWYTILNITAKVIPLKCSSNHATLPLILLRCISISCGGKVSQWPPSPRPTSPPNSLNSPALFHIGPATSASLLFIPQ